MLHPKKVGSLPIAGSEDTKQTNEIGMVIPLLDSLDLTGKDVTCDAIQTQRKLASYLVDRNAHYHFIVKGNQPTLYADIQLLFAKRDQPDYVDIDPPDHGRIETRRIWCSTALNHYLDFPHVGQVFLIEREVIHKKSGKHSLEVAFGITSRTPEHASPDNILAINRGHWVIENSCHYIIDWNYDEDRCRIRTGNGPENVTRLRRFAVGLLKSYTNGMTSVAEKMRQLGRNTRLVLDYLRMTENSTRQCAT
ncbi:MAG: hypothetical protein CVV06_11860 [Gammaproteobacteria bacterium HGW-Gammaproteobacteria-10]|nr:MAG: hypothetical protein CVV06_11860 [Gammaproteobacteria bacterium HGW-Gammaproteobacteria-10]